MAEAAEVAEPMGVVKAVEAVVVGGIGEGGGIGGGMLMRGIPGQCERSRLRSERPRNMRGTSEERRRTCPERSLSLVH